jgi:hypothetical protein
MMIWGYALGGQTIRLAPQQDPPKAVVWSKDRFPLLRVCRQVYSEAAILPYALNTFQFTCGKHYSDYARSGLIRHAQHISMWKYSWSWWGRNFPYEHARVLKTIEIALLLVPGIELPNINANKKPFENLLPGVRVTVRVLDKGSDW